MTDNKNAYEHFYERIDKVKDDLRNKYSNYEELLDYAAKAATELHIAKYEYQEFINGAFLREFLVADRSNQELAQLDERLKDNPIYQEFMHMKSHENKIYHSFPNEKRHAMDSFYKKSVTEDWGKEPSKFGSAEKAAEYYVGLLRDKHKTEYSQRTIADCIRNYAKQKSIRLR